MYGFADKLRKKGRFGDTLIAHLSEGEARMLRKAGGSGTTNPFTGAIEFYKGTLDGPVPSFYKNIVPESNVPDSANQAQNEAVPNSGLDSFYKNIEQLQNENQPTLNVSLTEPNAQYNAMAQILSQTRETHDDYENMKMPQFFAQKEVKNQDGSTSLRYFSPYSDAATTQVYDMMMVAAPNLWRSMAGKDRSDNEGHVARDMRKFLNFVYDPEKVDQMVLAKAIANLGIDQIDRSGKTRSSSMDGRHYYKTQNGKPISYADWRATGIMDSYGRLQSSMTTTANDDGTTTTGPTSVNAGSFDTFGAFMDAAFAPASYNQGSFMNLIEGPTMVRGGVLKRLWQRFKNLFNNPSTNPAGKPWMNKIDPSDHAGDAPPPDPTNYDQFGDFGYTGGTSGTTNSFTGRGSTSF